MTDDRFEEFLKMHGQGYNRPPPTPKDEMWSAIEGAISEEGTAIDTDVVSLASARLKKQATVHVRQQSWGVWAAAAAAVLIVGVGIGRMSIDPTSGIVAEVAVAPEPQTESMRSVARNYWGRTESLLTMVSTDARGGTVDAEMAQWGRMLLLQTRLLMDSSVADDPVIGRLLNDLEFILIQVAGLSSSGKDGSRDMEELEMIMEGLVDQNMMLRIRSAMPAGTVQAGI